MRASDRFFLKLGDLSLVWVGLVLSILIRTDFSWRKCLEYLNEQTWFFFSLSVVVVLLFWFRGLYSRDWRYVNITDVIDLGVTLVVAFIPFELMTLTSIGVAFPRTGLLIAFFPILFLLAGMRMTIRLSLERRARPQGALRYLVVGSDNPAETAVRELERSGGAAVGLLSVNPSGSTASIRGCPHLGQLEKLPELVEAHNVDGLILAGLTPSESARVVKATTDLDLKLRLLPPVSELLQGSLEVNTIRPLQLGDLLERDQVTVEQDKVGRYLQGQVVMVTGAGGSIGAEIVRQVVALKPTRMILLGRGENSIYEIHSELRQSLTAETLEATDLVCSITNVTDQAALERVFAKHRPQVVFHAAAHKHVPLMEAQPIEACLNNIFGTLNVMEMAKKYEVSSLVVLSTDKAVAPSSVMGATKRVTELLIHTSGHPGFAAVRFGNVLGSRGSVVPTLQKQIERGGPITITSAEMTRYFMTIPEAVALVLAAGAEADRGEIYVLEMGKPVRIIDLAENLVRLSGLTPHRDIEFVYCGARPGEKLHEELVYEGEESRPSEINGVVRVTPKKLPAGWPGQLLDSLRKAVSDGDEDAARKLLFDLLDD